MMRRVDDDARNIETRLILEGADPDDVDEQIAFFREYAADRSNDRSRTTANRSRPTSSKSLTR
jgi:hypothetical protein